VLRAPPPPFGPQEESRKKHWVAPSLTAQLPSTYPVDPEAVRVFQPSGWPPGRPWDRGVRESGHGKRPRSAALQIRAQEDWAPTIAPTRQHLAVLRFFPTIPFATASAI
jgi:hypothetical protein